MSGLKFFLLGKIHIERNGEAFNEFQSPQILGLLAFLLADRNHTHTREELIQLFWPDVSETSARNNLRVALFRLKSAFRDDLGNQPLITGTTRAIGINPDCQFYADIYTFQNVVERYQDDYYSTGTIRWKI